MREFASLLLAAALAAPFGGAGALSLGGADVCPAAPTWRIEAGLAHGRHGLRTGDGPAARHYLPAPVAAPGEGALEGGWSPGCAPAPRHAMVPGLRAPQPGRANRGGAPRILANAFLQGFSSHPPTAPPHAA